MCLMCVCVCVCVCVCTSYVSYVCVCVCVSCHSSCTLLCGYVIRASVSSVVVFSNRGPFRWLDSVTPYRAYIRLPRV